jgi:outer membrane protein assembly factor BamB
MSSKLFAGALTLALLGSSCAGDSEASGGSTGGPRASTTEASIGSGRLSPMAVESNPFLAPNGRNGIHGDGWATDVHDAPGPTSADAQVKLRSMSSGLGGLCATAVFDSDGRLFSVCTDLLNMRLVALDPVTLEILAEHRMPTRASNRSLNLEAVQSDTSGGAYFHLLKGDRPLIANAEGHLQIFRFEGDHFELESDWDLTPQLPDGAHIVDALPDHTGLYWVITREGHIGTFNAETEVLKFVSLAGEEVQNSVAIASDGVYLVSSHALYRFEADADGEPSFSYRIPYDRGSAKKPGAINQGSGTTPTLLPGGLVAISDNADAEVHVLVYHRLQDHEGERKICETPVFEAGEGFTENSLIGYQRSLIIENNYGYGGPLSNAWAKPGLTRVDVRKDFSGCDVVWTNTDVEGMTPVAKLSTQTGLVYTYTRSPRDNSAGSIFSFTAVDYFTGKKVFDVKVGEDNAVNNNYGPITLAADGTAYVGVLNGLVSIADM